MAIHTPVLSEEIVEIFQGGRHNCHTLVDCTTGEGGHTEILAERLHPQAILCFERDGEILEKARERLSRFTFINYINENFTHLEEYVKNREISGILLDLGISMYHYQQSGRGFSFLAEEPLDMRTDPRIGQSAYDLINNLKKTELESIIRNFGEESWAKRIAERIDEAKRRRETPKTAKDLADLIASAIPRKFWPKAIHPATKTFQALRIAVNGELDNLSSVLVQAMNSLAPGGRLCVITYHSLEDRIVKNAFRSAAAADAAEVFLLTKKPIVPTLKEITDNRAARSAKLRAVERRGGGAGDAGIYRTENES